MGDIPQRALDAAKAAAPPLPETLILRMLEAAEIAWPHDPAKRDPASSVTGALNLATAPPRLAAEQNAPGKRHGFGFGPAEVRA